MTTRRSFLTSTVALAALAQRPSRLWSQTSAASSPLTFAVDSKQHLATMPRNFTGLSYESAQLGHPDFFSGDNHALIALVKRLGSQGVLRIGGNTAEFTTWSDHDEDAAKNLTAAFGGSAVGLDGAFTPAPQSTLAIHRGRGAITLPAYTAAVIEI